MGAATTLLSALGTQRTRRALVTCGQSEFAQSDSGLLAEVNGVMDSIIYLVGLIVVVMFILSALGLH